MALIQPHRDKEMKGQRKPKCCILTRHRQVLWISGPEAYPWEQGLLVRHQSEKCPRSLFLWALRRWCSSKNTAREARDLVLTCTFLDTSLRHSISFSHESSTQKCSISTSLRNKHQGPMSAWAFWDSCVRERVLGPYSSPRVEVSHNESQASFSSPGVGDSKGGQQWPACVLVI